MCLDDGVKGIAADVTGSSRADKVEYSWADVKGLEAYQNTFGAILNEFVVLTTMTKGKLIDSLLCSYTRNLSSMSVPKEELEDKDRLTGVKNALLNRRVIKRLVTQ